MHYINLDYLPSFRSPFPSSERTDWLQHHFALSTGEEQSRFRTLGIPRTPEYDLKESIMLTFTNFFGNKAQGRPAIVHLVQQSEGTYTILFVSRVRIDLTAFTLVADSCVLPLTRDLLMGQPQLQRALGGIQGFMPSMQTSTPDEEIKWWNAYLPTAVERCRSWKHTPNCEYKTEGVPRSLKLAEDPLCSCGRGKNLGKFMEVEAWKMFRPYVTRAAIGLPFSTSVLGDIAAELRSKMGSVAAQMERRASGSNEVGEGSAHMKNDKCAKCGGAGKPKLLVCSRCKGTYYCSAACQKEDWKAHKKVCAK